MRQCVVPRNDITVDSAGYGIGWRGGAGGLRSRQWGANEQGASMAPGEAFRDNLKTVCEVGGAGAAAENVGIGRGEAGASGILAGSFKTVRSQ